MDRSMNTTPDGIRVNFTAAEGSHKVLVLDMMAAAAEERFEIAEVAACAKAQKPVALALMSLLRRDGWITTTSAQRGDDRLKVHGMSQRQADTWAQWRSRIVGAKPTRGAPRAVKLANPEGADQNRAAVLSRAPILNLGIWSDGSLSIEGLAAKAVRVSAHDVGVLSTLVASLPEGALQALIDSPLQPQFTLHSNGRSYRLQGQQTRQLVDYLETLPKRWVRTEQAPALPWAGLLRPGTDHRTHRIAQPGEEDEA
jgi:hypothetical protein